jgi:hypothetical protein
MSRRTAAAVLTLVVALAPHMASATIDSQSITTSNAGNGGYSIRQKIPAPPGPFRQIRLSSKSMGGPFQTDHVSLCQSVGPSGDCAALPVEVTFPASCGTGCTGGSGGHGFALAAANEIAVSDWINILPTAPDLVVIYVIAASMPGDIADSSGMSGVMAWYAAVPLLQTQASAGASSSSMMLGVQ